MAHLRIGRRRSAGLGIAVLVWLGAAACGQPAAEQQQITVSAASALTDAFAALEQRFEADHPGVDVVVNVGGSSALAAQVEAGAPVDVVALASAEAMQPLVDRGLVTGVTQIAANSLALAVPAGNPAGITDLASLARPDVAWVMCDAPVPCGVAARGLLAANGVAATPVSLEPDVRAVLAKVVADEADAGIVYRTDVLAAASSVESIAIPDEDNVRTELVAATTDRAGTQAVAFVDFVRSGDGQSVLASFGFETVQ